MPPTDETPDLKVTDSPSPEPVTSEPDPLPPTQPKTEAEMQEEFDRYKQPPVDRSLTWPHEPRIAMKYPQALRGQLVNQLFDAADALGYPREAVRSQSDGFLVPSQIYYHLFPSQAPAPEADKTDE